MTADESTKHKEGDIDNHTDGDVNLIQENEVQDEEELKEYLGETLFPLIEFGIEELEKTRPPDPVSFLAHFLLRHNPKRKR